MARRLTPADRPQDLRRRGLAEAEFTRRAGDPIRARSLVQELLEVWPPGPTRAEALMLLGWVQIGIDARAAAATLREAIAQPGIDDRVWMRCEGGLTAAIDVLGEDVADALVHGRRELALAERLGDDVSLATSLRGIARNEQRRTGRMPVDMITRALALEPKVGLARPVEEWPSNCLAEMLSWTDDLSTALERWEWLLAQALERGEEHGSSWMLAVMVPYECIPGRWDRALMRAVECYELARATDQVALQATALADRAFVEAHLGDATAARDHAEEAIRIGAPVQARIAERTASWALGLLELSLANPAAAHARLEPLVASRRAAGIAEPGCLRFVPDEIEALIALDRLDGADAMLDWFEGLVAAGDRVHAWAAVQRCRGLLHAARGNLDAAMAALEASRSSYASIDEPFGLGRTLLALGSVQRRALRRRAARETLSASLETFAALRAELWAATASTELARIGGRSSMPGELTASQRLVASLVAEGLTNREVAARLVVTERTVEGHLSQIYAKLGARSRVELARRLGTPSDSPS
jgi:DNA-binding CsgD family transcriptional regulator